MSAFLYDCGDFDQSCKCVHMRQHKNSTFMLTYPIIVHLIIDEDCGETTTSRTVMPYKNVIKLISSAYSIPTHCARVPGYFSVLQFMVILKKNTYNFISVG